MNIRSWSPPEWDRDDEAPTRFRHAFVLKPGPYNFEPLKKQCKKIVYATDGFANEVDQMKEQLEESLVNFDARKDVLVAVGSANLAVIAGTILARQIKEKGHKDWQSYALGVYTDEKYLFWRVHISPSMKPYEFV